MIILFPLAIILSDKATNPPPAKAPVATEAAPMSESLAVARRIILKMRVEEAQRLALPKLAPLFALSVLSMPQDKMPVEVRAALQAPDGRLRVARILTEEYSAAFEVRLPQLSASIAAQLAKDLSLADLQSIDAFLDTPPGQAWSGELLMLQKAGADAGRKAGEAAGAAAAVATIQRLRGRGTGS